MAGDVRVPCVIGRHRVAAIDQAAAAQPGPEEVALRVELREEEVHATSRLQRGLAKLHIIRDFAGQGVGICLVDPTTRQCRGCLRTIDEIARWYEASAAEKRAILVALEARRAASTKA